MFAVISFLISQTMEQAMDQSRRNLCIDKSQSSYALRAVYTEPLYRREAASIMRLVREISPEDGVAKH